MNLIASNGLLTRYSPKQVRAQLGLTVSELRRFVESGVLRKRGNGRRCFFQKDVNEFIVRFNAGEID